jgi:DNA invertase Pin-like site-specific DNA recombinase
VVVLASLNLNTQFLRPAPTDRSPASRSVNRKRRITQRDRDEVVRLYTSGQTALEVAEALGIGKTTVLTILKQAGVEVRPRGCRKS